MKAITLHIAATAALNAPVIVGDEPSLPKAAPFTHVHGQMPIKKIKAFGDSGTHTRLTNKQMVKRKRKLKRIQRQRMQAR